MMTKDEKERMLLLAKATEHLWAENAALKVTLESHHVAPAVYERECKELIDDPKLSALVRKQFQPLYDDIQQAPDLSRALESFAQKISESSTKH